MRNKLDEHVVAYEGDSLYDFDNKIILTWYPQRILEFMPKAESLLELGLGHGFTANIFSKHFNNHTILEGSYEIIKNFKKKFPECSANIIETYFEDFKTDKKFDIIVMGFVLEHVDNPVEILNLYKKMLTPDGRMFIAVPNAESMNRRLGHYAGFLPDMQMLSSSDLEQGHRRYYTVESLKEELCNVNLFVEKMEGIYLKPFTTQQIKSLDLKAEVIEAMCKLGIDFPELCLGILTQVRESK